MTSNRYELVLLGPAKDRYRDKIVEAVSGLFMAIGLDFSQDGAALFGAKMPDWAGFPVAIWFGDKSKANEKELAVLTEFLSRGFSVLPVIADLKDYSAQVPKELYPINGQDWNVDRVSADVMRGFRLARSLRQAFISYRRSESSGVAGQLFHGLSDRTFRVFLDTTSVEGGVDFQRALWGRMADVDVVILLDSPTALDSDWVHQELNRAHDLGLAVVQLIWPSHKPSFGTDLSFPVQLDAADFEGGKVDRFGTLKPVKLTEIIDIIETQRIRSLSARRTRLVEGLLDHATGKGYTIYVHPMRNVDVLKGSSKIAEIIPFVGVPDALAVYQHETSKKHEPTIVVYNGLGVDPEWATHLRWLSDKVAVGVHQIDDFGIYISKIV
jgi:hypothetical protein